MVSPRQNSFQGHHLLLPCRPLQTNAAAACTADPGPPVSTQRDSKLRRQFTYQCQLKTCLRDEVRLPCISQYCTLCPMQGRYYHSERKHQQPSVAAVGTQTGTCSNPTKNIGQGLAGNAFDTAGACTQKGHPPTLLPFPAALHARLPPPPVGVTKQGIALPSCCLHWLPAQQHTCMCCVWSRMPISIVFPIP
jgi:hypothetical protein